MNNNSEIKKSKINPSKSLFNSTDDMGLGRLKRVSIYIISYIGLGILVGLETKVSTIIIDIIPILILATIYIGNVIINRKGISLKNSTKFKLLDIMGQIIAILLILFWIQNTVQKVFEITELLNNL